jgi:cardiolipin synthase C
MGPRSNILKEALEDMLPNIERTHKRHPGGTFRLAVAGALCLWLTGCASLPANTARVPSTALSPSAETRLGKMLDPKIAQHPGESGVCPLSQGPDALAARLELADVAERSLDLQYYIWRGDETGVQLAEHVLAAADRGVRVRVLLDDFGSTAKDETLLALDAHSNIEVRVYNPIALRGMRVLGSLMDFSRTTRRMHNKSFTADNQAIIVGGRNIGDEYFGADEALDFADLDVLAVGPVVREVTAAFDVFWNSSASYPITTVNRSAVPPGALDKFRTPPSPQEAQIAQRIRDGDLAFDWCKAWVVCDSPEKTKGLPAHQHQLLGQLRPTAMETKQELVIISPYFVPREKGLEFFREMRRSGVRVILVSNSLAATDAVAVHAGYSRYRKELLRMGVELYELKPTGNESLHAKSFVFDRRDLFIGSFNFDPRSANLNTEMGIVFESPELAGPMVARLEAKLAEKAWRVELVPGPDHSSRLVWVSKTGRQMVEPDASFSRRLIVALIGWLPVEGQL